MSRPLAESVYVAGRFYAAGVVPDEEDAALITNPRAWGDPVEADRPSRRQRVTEPTTDPVAPTDPPAEPGAVTDPAVADPAFDPSADGVGVDDVNNHLANADETEVARVLKLEVDGKKRKGILEGPYAPDETGGA